MMISKIYRSTHCSSMRGSDLAEAGRQAYNIPGGDHLEGMAKGRKAFVRVCGEAATAEQKGAKGRL